MGCFIFLQTDYASSYFLSLVNSPSGSGNSTKIEVKNIKGIIPFSIRIDELGISDRSGKWLVIKNCSVKISPFELLKGHFFIEQIYAEKTDVLRLPEGNKDKQKKLPDTIEFPSFITRITPGDIEMLDVTLGESILGYPAVFSIKGTPGSTDSVNYKSYSLNVKRTDSDAESLSVIMSLVKKEDSFKIDIDAHDPGKGILYHTAGLGENLKLSFDGKGQLALWDAKLSLSSSDTGVITSDIKVSADDDIKLKLSGHLDPSGRIVPEQYRDIAEKGADFRVDISLTDNKTVKVNTFEITGSDIKASVKGEINTLDLKSQLGFDVIIKNYANLINTEAGYEISDVMVEGSLKGKLFEPDINVSFSMAGITGNKFRVSDVKTKADVAFNNHADKTSVSCSGGTGAVVIRSKGKEYRKDNTAFKFDLELNSLKELSLNDFVFNAQGFSLTASGNALLSDLSFNGAVKGAYQPELENNDLRKIFKDEVTFKGFLSFRENTLNFKDILVETGVMTLKGKGQLRVG